MKVLVICHNSFSTTHNNGKTLSAIFSCFSKEELCQLYFTPIGNQDFERCNQYYLISNSDALKSIFRRRKCGQQIMMGLNNVNLSVKRKHNCHSFFTQIIRDVIFFFSSWYNGGLNKWLKEQRPDIIFFVGGDAEFSHQIAIRLSHILDIPLTTYFTDDYVINPPSSLYLKRLRKIYSNTITQSRRLFAIGNKMAKDYSVFFNKPFLPIMNIVDIPNCPPPYVKKEGLLRINYFGGLHLGRGEELVRFFKFIRTKIEPRINETIEMGIFTFSSINEKMRELFCKFDVTISKGLVGNDLKEAMNTTDIFIHVESIEKQYRLLTRLSVSTKIPEYMSLAKPIIAFGPSDVASFGVISDADPTLVINDCVSINENIIQDLIDVLNDSRRIQEIGIANYNFAKKNFDIRIISRKFRQELEHVVSQL